MGQDRREKINELKEKSLDVRTFVPLDIKKPRPTIDGSGSVNPE